MDIEAFREQLPRLWHGDPQSADHPIDRMFKPVIDETQGMATENKLAVLNLAASLLEEGEAFLEIGTYRGTSVIGASLHNPTRPFLAVDNFSQFEGSEEQCLKNIESFGCQNIHLINRDAWAVLREGNVGRPIGAYFYDGGHRFKEQWQALDLVTPLLADHAVVIVDDVSHRPVAAATRTFAESDRRFERLFWFDSPFNGEPRWWNGLAIYGFRRDLAVNRQSPLSSFKRYFYEFKYGPPYEFTRRMMARLHLLGHRLKRTIRAHRASISEGNGP